ncbi:MAG: DUF167 domain-containing protein [Armatimonadota bacterium]
MDSATINVRVQPRASRNEVAKWSNGVLIIRVTAPPVEGAANRACIDLVAEALGVRTSQIELVSGQKSRNKVLSVSGLSQDEADARLAAFDKA